MLTVNQMFDKVMNAICDNHKNDSADAHMSISLKPTAMKIQVSEQVSLSNLDTTDLAIGMSDSKTVISYSV